MARLEVLNPVAETVQYRVQPAPRLPDLKGRTVGLYWNMKAGGNIALEEVARLLAERYPGVRFRHYTGSVGALMRHATPQDAERMARECDAVIGTTSD